MKTTAIHISKGIRIGFWLILVFSTILSTKIVNDYYSNKGSMADNRIDQTGIKTFPSVTLPAAEPEAINEPDLKIEKWMMIESYWTGKPTTLSKNEEVKIPFAR